MYYNSLRMSGFLVLIRRECDIAKFVIRSLHRVVLHWDISEHDTKREREVQITAYMCALINEALEFF